MIPYDTSHQIFALFFYLFLLDRNLGLPGAAQCKTRWTTTALPLEACELGQEMQEFVEKAETRRYLQIMMSTSVVNADVGSTFARRKLPCYASRASEAHLDASQ